MNTPLIHPARVMGLPEPCRKEADVPKVPLASGESSRVPATSEGSAERPAFEDPLNKHHFRVEDVWV